ncbi:ABC transporter permease [Halalkalibacter okhensis]|uniref:ABC transporter permease n=1 Tax=Halalkalibacter okhensis TaxID=333138 RepID=A0A0B0I5U9_9BACI|nr:ABC transporter permease [Halalkalibacter okhensis]KHF37808.1 ABC transporter permease [Halalkalibacter okhensis]
MSKYAKSRDFLLAILFIFVVWWGYITLFTIPAFMLPSPLAVGTSFWGMLSNGEILPHFFITFFEVVIGFVIGLILGLMIGYVISKNHYVKEALMPYIIFAQTAPKIALAPLFVIWFGLGLTSKLVLIISMVFFPIMLSTIYGLKEVSYNLKCLMRINKLNWWKRMTTIEFPSSLPHIFSGMKLGIVQAVIAAIVAEWISGQSGLGYLLTYTSTTYDTAGLFSVIIYTVILGFLFYQILNYLENKLLFWHESKNPSI